MKKIIFLLLVILSLITCGKNKKDYIKKETNTVVTEEVTSVHQGRELLKKKCFICHNPVLSESSMVAPPMIAIKAHYINKNTTKEQFTEDLLRFLKKPTNENARMPEAVKRFGLMSYQSFKEEDIKKIAEYIYDFKIKEPKWFKNHWKEQNKKMYINTNRKTKG